LEFNNTIEGAAVLSAALLSFCAMDNPAFKGLEKISNVDWNDIMEFSSLLLKLFAEEPEEGEN
jgi:hypothetical protein